VGESQDWGNTNQVLRTRAVFGEVEESARHFEPSLPDRAPVEREAEITTGTVLLSTARLHLNPCPTSATHSGLSSVLYLDCHQEEGATGRSETSLMMQVLFNAVYERAKETDKRVVFVSSETHF